MASLRDITAYLCGNYPHSHELSKTRLTKLVYLADWFSSRKFGKQITKIEWFFDNYGPYVDDVINDVQENSDIFDVEVTRNIYGSEKMLVSLKPSVNVKINLSSDEVTILDEVIDATRSLYWKPFLKFVYDTPPIAEADRYQQLNLVKKAKEINARARQ